MHHTPLFPFMMKLNSPYFLLSLSTFLRATLAVDLEAVIEFEKYGTCAFYFDHERPGNWSPLEHTCVNFCKNKNNGEHGYSACDHSPYKDTNFETLGSSVLRDEQGYPYLPCNCSCENEAVEELTEIVAAAVAEALEELDFLKWLCVGFLEAFRITAEVGIMFVPGGMALKGAQTAVRAAKSFMENGLESTDYFTDWIGKACDVPDYPGLFGLLVDAPDSFGTSIGCKRKNKSKCKKMEEKPDPTNKPDAPPLSTKKDEPIPSSKEEPVPPSTRANEHSTANSIGTQPPAPPSSAVLVSSAQTISSPPSTSLVSISPTNSPSSFPSSISPSSVSTLSTSTTVSLDECAAATGTQSAAACGRSTPCERSSRDTELLEDSGVDSIQGKGGYMDFRRAILENRADKSGNPCSASTGNKGFVLRSDNYPANGRLPADTPAYGWQKPKNICDYEWQSGSKANAGSSYDSEHVLEFQTIVEFFAKMNEKGGENYEHPYPAKKKTKVDFCTYWIESWSFHPSQTFSISGGTTMGPWKHIAAAYPSSLNYKNEFVRLQRQINSPAKANLFADHVELIYTKKDMEAWVKQRKTRDEVLERLRYVLGARKYLTEPKVQEIFKKQKTRMGKVFDDIETELAVRPRQFKKESDTVIYHPWQKQNLQTEWDNFMDAKWKTATEKNKEFMDTYLEELEKNFCGSQSKKLEGDREFCERYRKLDAEYRKALAFTKPW